jgi:hypothetical protein
MAVLNAVELEDMQRRAANRAAVVTWTKAPIRSALQAIEDLVTGVATRNAINSAIETAAPGVFTVPQKESLFELWCFLNAKRGGII